MVVPTGHPIGGTAFVAAQLNWTFFHLGTWIGGVNAPAGCNFVAIVPFFSDTSLLSTMQPMTTTTGGFSTLDRHFNCCLELIATGRFSSVTSRSVQCSVGLECPTQCTITASSRLVLLAFQEAKQVIGGFNGLILNFQPILFATHLSSVMTLMCGLELKRLLRGRRWKTFQIEASTNL
jgi:hypothetical protein